MQICFVQGDPFPHSRRVAAMPLDPQQLLGPVWSHLSSQEREHMACLASAPGMATYQQPNGSAVAAGSVVTPFPKAMPRMPTTLKRAEGGHFGNETKAPRTPTYPPTSQPCATNWLVPQQVVRIATNLVWSAELLVQGDRSPHSRRVEAMLLDARQLLCPARSHLSGQECENISGLASAPGMTTYQQPNGSTF